MDIDLQGSCILLKMKLNFRSDWCRTKMKFRFRCLDFAILKFSKTYNEQKRELFDVAI
jgi:hypothetical protein